MAQTNLDFSEKEEEKITKLKLKWKLSKPDAIRKIVREYEEEKK